MKARPRESSIDQDAIREILEGTSAETGEAFFDELVKHLARALGTKCAWVTEWIPEKRHLRALSFWVGGGYFGEYEYDIVHTPCETEIDETRLVHVPDRLLELYHGDPDLKPLGAMSYLGIPLLETTGEIIGHLAVIHDEPLPEDPRAEGIFRIFASRAAAELRRIRRDREIRERERKLSRIIESAMDAIIELDERLAITGLNPAAEKTFGVEAVAVVGSPFDGLLTASSRGRLLPLFEEIGRLPEGMRSIWIPDGIEAVRAGGDAFPAEATLSGFEIGGRRFFTLILRNVDERIAAERHIRSLVSETAYLRSELDAAHGFSDIVGESEALRRVLADVGRVADGRTSVLVTGETGTGKELIARAIHRLSPRAEKPLIKVNCAAIPASLQESEFFGHERGAFTGATQQREGRFKLADGGTIFLDEVGEMPLDLQVKLLRVLQEGEFEPVGSSRTERVDVRVIAATNRDLDKMVDEGSFRRDLLFRLNVFPIHVPPLRERGDDVVLLAEKFARALGADHGRRVSPLTPSCKARLKRYSWPGNVRELQNVIERALITSTDGAVLNLDQALPETNGDAPSVPDRPLPAAAASFERVLTAGELRALERDNLIRALRKTGWKISGRSGAASLLGLNPNTLASRLRALGIERPRSG
ncbi:MAG: PAS domain S-box protein [Candidatus Latescibacterota bacterium]|nr:MAG: PAS domain S-box protein [Candidatus Latescibacterota bacterium]